MKRAVQLSLFNGLLFMLLAVGPPVTSQAAETPPDNSGPIKLLKASWLGGPFDDDIVAAEIAPDMSIVLAGNTVDLQLPHVAPATLGPAGVLDASAAPPAGDAAKTWRHPSTRGFVLRLSTDGQKVLSYATFGYGKATIEKMRLDAQGQIFVLGKSPHPEASNDDGKGKTKGKGNQSGSTFVATLAASGTKLLSLIEHPDMSDFGVDSNGEIVVLSKSNLTRYAADGKTAKWTVSWKSHGDNRPGGMTVSPDTGIAAVTGYGMTRTGKEPYKDPYGYGFDREGKQIWAIWNPDPAKEKDAKYSSAELKTNGLMADTTGHAASFGAGGKIYFMLYADGGNTVCTRDPLDVDQPLDKSVFDGVFQAGPGYGFKGASKTSVIFRIDARQGKIEKGTWMSAWVNKQRASALAIDAATCDDRGRQFIVGDSASGCPTKQPWYICKVGGYAGGGFLAVMDRDFKMLQCGYFPASTIHCVGARDGYVVIAGNVKQYEDEAAKVESRVFKPLQPQFGGRKDGYFAVFKATE